MNGRWTPAIAAAAFGAAIFGFAAAAGHAWELVWFPAVVLGAAWPRTDGTTPGACLRRLGTDR